MEQISAFVAYKAAAANAKNKSSKSNSSKQKQKSNKKKEMTSTHAEKSQSTHKRKSSSDISKIASPAKASSFSSPVAITIGSQDSTVSSSQGNKDRSNQSNTVVGVQPITSGGVQKSLNIKQKTGSTMAGPSNMAIPTAASTNSIEIGQSFFENLIGGIDREQFMTHYWERKPLHISRQRPEIYNSLGISLASIDEMLRSNMVEFTKNLDITSYVDGKRHTHNPDGRAMPDTVWGFYEDGCSVRLLNPQAFIPQLHHLNATLQEFAQCMVGTNIYLTPPGTQGFSPHYDDIEAFVLQVEGKKRWRLYRPRNEAEMLPRESSGNFSKADVKEMELALEVILKPGDLLYFPRGWIHQANTIEGHHSLHITLSLYQHTSFADLFEEMMKRTLKNAITNETSFRYGLPLDIWRHFGASYENVKSVRKEHIKDHIRNLFERLINHIDIDEAVDRLAVKFQHDALPPFLTQDEKKLLSIGTLATPNANGNITIRRPQGSTEIRLTRANCVRLTYFDGERRLYYSTDNSKEYHEYDVNYIELDASALLIANKLINTYPEYIKIRDLDDDYENALGIATALWERGLLMSKKPL